MKAKDVMTKEVITVKPEMEIRKLAELFIEKDISGAPVVDEKNKVIGIVLEEGLILQDKNIHLPTLISILSGVFAIGEQKFESEIKKMAAITVSGIMEDKMIPVSPETSIDDIATMVIEKGVHYFPVIEGGMLAGVVTKKDIVRAIAQNKIW